MTEQEVNTKEAALPVFVCENCNEESAWSDNLGDRFVKDIPGIGKVYETGITCSNCKHFTLVAYMSDKMLKARDHLASKAEAVKNSRPEEAEESFRRYGMELQRYRSRFEKFNKEMAKRFGTRLAGQEEWERQKMSRAMKQSQQ